MVTSIRLTCASLLALVLITMTQADSVQLTNGDILNGKVVGLDDKILRVDSEVLGSMNIPRAKVASITLGDAKPIAAAPAAPLPAGAPVAGKDLTPNEIIQQLQRAGGVNPKDIGDIQKMLPLLATPEASAFFQDKLRGLTTGNLSVDDIRKDAIRARDQVKDLTKGLGPDADQALRPYLSILEKFIDEADPARKKK